MKQRIVFLDIVRAISCLMVIIVHTCEPYYLGANDVIGFENPTDRLWVAIIDGACRCSVPLFVMTSSYLLLPLKTGGFEFMRRRWKRIFVPFLIWSAFYAVIPFVQGHIDTETVTGRLLRLLYNFNNDSGHLWYIWMLMGIYLIMPVISPWLRTCSKRGEEAFLAIWAISTFYEYLSPVLGPIWGQCAWNDFHALYYYSGYLGYVVLAHYLRFHVNWSPKKYLAAGLPLYLVGYAFTAGIYYVHAGVSSDYAYVEQPWQFCTFNILLMTLGAFLMFRAIKTVPMTVYKPFEDISKQSYGIYLIHIFILGLMFSIFGKILPIQINVFVIGLSTFLTSYLICKLLSKLHGGKYIVG